MGKLLYTVYSLVVVSVMSAFSFAQPSGPSGQANSNSYYHGGSSGSGSGGGGGGHK